MTAPADIAHINEPALQAIAGRRSIYKFSAAMPPEKDIRLVLDLAVLAPNHRRTQPWRFAVFAGEGLQRLACILAAAAASRGLNAERARSKLLIAPAVVCVGVSPKLNRPKVVELEEVLAVGAAIQNMLVALHAIGLGGLWTTGALIDAPELGEFLGWRAPGERVIGIVHIGYPDPSDSPAPRSVEHRPFTAWYC
jgi:nitroreductase